MKKLFFFLAASAAMFTSCSSDDDAATTPVEDGVTAIDVTSNISTTTIGGSFTFTVKDQAGNVLPTATLTVSGAAITNPWTPTAAGTYTVNAAFETFTDAVTVTVTEAPVVEVPQTVNTFAINNGEELLTDKSYLVYLGTDENNTNFWVAASFSTDGNDEVVNEADIYFTNTQVDEQYLDVPTVGNMTFGETVPGTVDTAIVYNGTELTTTDLIQSLDLNIISIAIPAAEGDPQNWNYTYNLTLTDGTIVKGNFNGDWQFINASGSAGRNTNTNKQVVKLSNTQIKQNLKNYLKK